MCTPSPHPSNHFWGLLIFFHNVSLLPVKLGLGGFLRARVCEFTCFCVLLWAS